MNTAEFDTRLRRQRRPERTEPRLQAVPTPPVGVTVLSTDAALCEAIKEAAGTQYPVSTAANLEETEQLAIEGKCGILVTDQALSQHALTQIGKQMRAHDPATITIAVGSRGDDNALIGLLSSAVVERFMLKPITPSLARLVLRSAASEYQSLKFRARREQVAEEPAPRETSAPEQPAPATIPAPQESITQERPARAQAKVAAAEEQPGEAPVVAEPRLAVAAQETMPAVRSTRSVWLIAAAAALLVGVAVWWMMRAQMPQIDPQQIVATNLIAAKQAFDEGRYVDPPENSALHHYSVALSLDAANVEAKRGLEAVAARMIEDVKLAIVDGRLAEAGIALERVRRLTPDNRRLSTLESELRQEQASQIARLQAPVVVARSEAAPVPSSAKASSNAAKKRVAPAPPRASIAEAAPAAAALVASSGAAVSSGSLDMGPPAPVVERSVPAPATAEEPAMAAATLPPPVAVEPKLVRMIQPEFPREARARNVEGWVDVTLGVDIWGQVTTARVTDSENGRFFERAAMASVKQWRYEPRPYADPKSTEDVKVRVKFKLQK